MPFTREKTPLKGSSFRPVVEEFRQAERRIGEEEGGVRPIDKVVRAIQPLPVEPVGKYDRRTCGLHADHAVIAALVERQVTAWIEGHPIGALLAAYTGYVGWLAWNPR